MNDYGKNIKEARKKAGLTQKELADASGVAKITIQQYEAGKRQPRLEQLGMLAEAMHVSIDELLGISPLPSKEIVCNPGFPSECIIMEEGKEVENLASFYFLDELGYKMFCDPRVNYEENKDAGNQRILYDCRENIAYSITWDRLAKLRENVIAFAKFQMNELLANSEVANDIEEYLEELRYYKEIPSLSKAEKA